MASSSPIASAFSWLGKENSPSPTIQPYGYIATALLVVVFSILLKVSKHDDLPLLQPPPKWFRPTFLAQIEFFKIGKELISKGRATLPGKPYKILSDSGEVLVLPTRFANVIRNEEDLSFGAVVMRDLHGKIPGFQPFGFVDDDKKILQVVARKQLTKSLNTITEPLSLETAFAANLIFGDSQEWHQLPLKDTILDLVARLSSRVFLGPELCRNEDWLRITKDYTVLSFKAAFKLRAVPLRLRPLLHWFSADCRRTRESLAEAQKLIAPVIEKRRAEKRAAAAATVEGQAAVVPVSNDAIEWAEAEAQGGAYDAAIFQLTLSFVAIHTTTDLLAQTLIYLASEPDLIDPLRAEIVEVLKAEGWKKSALYNMKLLDSAIKETQRMKPVSMLLMRRLATKDVTLPDDNITIRRGDTVSVDTYSSIDPTVYENPETYDIHRFRRMREQPGGANKAQLVTTSPEHLGFGHGLHACPGRFFASNEVKVALCHLLLKYDWKLAPGSPSEPVITGASMNVNPKAVVMVKRRVEEFDIDNLGFGDLDA
ncbi:ent-kaurene oxidase [Colletotrichum scovillei]|uniref:ent-kaurene oxidase n=1 Tax=Colletotrichum scovillei TaxID=1209932 RepID=UPI0015C3AC9C|nr:ent-kaurene oxidase [Colletotrichum scovillei]KAF4780766.1 ent-kaurene oxidase [Colletotrichum scovillei]KAG7052803.1 gibberellin cluster-C20-oxidase [Colletotrichum scovillei]